MAWCFAAASHALGRRGLVIAWVALGAAGFPGGSQAAVDSPYFSSAPLALYATASAPRVAEGSDVDIVELHESYVFEADGSDLYTQYFLYKILSPAAAQRWKQLAIEWSPWRDEKPTMRARVITADGKEYKLDQATIADSPAHVGDPTLYGDARSLRAPLPAVAPGAVVETQIVLRERPPFAGAGKVGRSIFQMDDPIQHFRLTLQAPKTLSLRYRLDLLPRLSPAHSEESGSERWVFDSGPIPAGEDVPPGLPADVATYPMVTFSTGSSWRVLAEEYYKIVAARLAEADVNELVARLTKGRSTREAKAEAIIEYLNQEIRYTGIEFDQASVVPHSVAETLSRKYGDCKDKSLLLVAMLRAAGIPANVALLNAGERMDVPGELPGIGLFDHVIVYVPGDPVLWVDATDEYARLGQLRDDDHGRQALIVAPDTAALTRVIEARSVEDSQVPGRPVAFIAARNGEPPGRSVYQERVIRCISGRWRT